MSVIVVTRTRARPGGETALIAAAVRSTRAPGASRGALTTPRLFQGYDDPERFYWVSEWESRELYLAGVPSGPADDWLNDVCADDLERSFFAPLGAPDAALGAAAGGALVGLGEAAGRTAHAYSEQLVGQLRGQPGIRAVALFRGLEESGLYLALCAWESESARQQFSAAVLPRYEAAVREHGGWLEPFVERTLDEVDRYPREPNGARPAIRAGQAPTD